MCAVDDHGAVELGQLTSYVGRTGDENDVRGLLETARLVTLTGPGGVGKTRLAGRVASSMTHAFPDGVVVVSLAELSEASLLTRTLADCLGLHDTAGRPVRDAVVAHLRDRHVLLLLDNCEHLVDSCAGLVLSLLRRCPGVRVLATSRSSLGVAGEHVLPVAPLAVPPETAGTPELAMAYGSVRLFADRAAAVLPSFRLTGDNVGPVTEVCRQLDGLPLAVELAAARIRALSPRQIADRVSASLTLLTTGARSLPERHRTLRATVEGSYALCTDLEREVWERCSVFAGPFELPAVDGPADVLDAVDGLVDKSVLLRVEGAAGVRYKMLNALREFGQERLAETGAADVAARRHRDYHARLLEQAGAEWLGPRRDDWFARLSAGHADIRAALSWSLRTGGEAVIALRMATSVLEYWLARGAVWEVREWTDRALAAMPAEAAGRSRGQAVAALCSALHADLPGARQRLARAEAVRDEDAAPYLCHARAFVAMLAVEPHAIEHAAEAVRLFEARGQVRQQLHPMFIQGVSMAYRGDLAGARLLLEGMRRLCEAAQDDSYRSMALFGLGVVEVCYGGDLGTGERAIRDALDIDLRGPDLLSAAYRVDGLAWVSARREDWRRAARLFGAAAALWDQCGSEPDVAVALPHREAVKAARGALGDARFEELSGEGHRANLHDVLATERPPTGGVVVLPPLTRRESEIAGLVANGLTNREIAVHLVISRRTAETHLEHIFTKLRLGNRTQVAIWVNEQLRHDDDLRSGQ
ncbi:ATP-binding protein [Amycolatopsis sp. cmx-4-83]|uniref:ATP-binding protein n=1 Tax=Amycolatopsis sp. cmx-4-83 TaxID=2790940 RepID=UPI00397CE428